MTDYTANDPVHCPYCDHPILAKNMKRHQIIYHGKAFSPGEKAPCLEDLPGYLP